MFVTSAMMNPGENLESWVTLIPRRVDLSETNVKFLEVPAISSPVYDSMEDIHKEETLANLHS
jgi:hypothetical protein